MPVQMSRVSATGEVVSTVRMASARQRTGRESG